jgi:hypothetical protein
MQIAQWSSLGRQLAALQQDNAQLRTMYRQLESKLALLSSEPACGQSELASDLPASNATALQLQQFACMYVSSQRVVLQEVREFKTRTVSQQSKVLSVLSGTCAQGLLCSSPQLATWH